MVAVTHYSMRPMENITEDYMAEARAIYKRASKDFNAMGMADLIACLIVVHEKRLDE